MINRFGISAVRAFLRREKLPFDTVRSFYGRTVAIAFDDLRYDQQKAEEIMTAVGRCKFIRAEGMLWLPEYLEATGGEFRPGDDRVLLADLTDPRMYYATAMEAREWKLENIIEILPSGFPREVYLPLKFKFFDEIETGSKTVECRRYCETWVRRLLGPPVERLRFQRGYAKGARQMIWTVSRIELADADGVRRYSHDTMPDFPEPEWILLHLGRRVG